MRASDSRKAILNGVNVRNMLMEFLAASNDGHDTCCVTGGQQVRKLRECGTKQKREFSFILQYESFLEIK